MYPSNQFFGFNTNKLELYPRRRATEFYHKPQPLEEFQSRISEHPQDKLNYKNDAISERPQDKLNYKNDATIKCQRIAPPRNSDMRMFRNSYFS